MTRSIYIGFDSTQADAYAVAVDSTRFFLKKDIPIQGICLPVMRLLGLYTRKTRIEGNGFLVDVISDASMSTEFAISRFLTPLLARKGWALFMDSDVLVRTDLNELFDLADPSKAVMCVKHSQKPLPHDTKMVGQEQTSYYRKNWSSVVLYNCDHPANRELTVELINKVPGRELHRFCWLADEHIGELGLEWNYLIGHSKGVLNPKIVHFTLGTPNMRGHENTEYAAEWRDSLIHWAGTI